MNDNLNVEVQTSAEMLENLLGNRRLTRRVIAAFPEDALFSFSLGGMRPFAEIVRELLMMGAPMVMGVASGEWDGFPDIAVPDSKADLLAAWDADTEAIEEVWPSITRERFAAVEKAFGVFTSSGYRSLRYSVENEIHHRAQGFVYLRALGIEPPAFYERD